MLHLLPEKYSLAFLIYHVICSRVLSSMVGWSELNAPRGSRQVVVDMQGYLEAADGAKGEPLPSVAGGENVEATAGMHCCARRFGTAALRDSARRSPAFCGVLLILII